MELPTCDLDSLGTPNELAEALAEPLLGPVAPQGRRFAGEVGPGRVYHRESIAPPDQAYPKPRELFFEDARQRLIRWDGFVGVVDLQRLGVDLVHGEVKMLVFLLTMAHRDVKAEVGFWADARTVELVSKSPFAARRSAADAALCAVEKLTMAIRILEHSQFKRPLRVARHAT